MVYRRSLDDTLDAWEDDVKRYLRETIPKIPPYAQFIREHPEDLEHLVERAGGVFVYARIAINFLDTYRDHPEEQFGLLLSSLGAGVEPLDALYLQVLRSAFPPNYLRTSPPHRERLHAFLTSLILLNGSHSPDVIASFCHGIDKDDVISMVDRLRSVLLVSTGGEVRPIHATLGEFLLDEARCTDPLYHVDRLKEHAQIASACFAAFSVKTMTDCLAVDPTQTLTSAIWQHVHYASAYWAIHLQAAGFSEELLKRLHTFNTEQMPVYRRSVLEEDRESFGTIMRGFKSWLMVSNLCLSFPMRWRVNGSYVFAYRIDFRKRAGGTRDKP